jgi:type II secretion system protein N
VAPPAQRRGGVPRALRIGGLVLAGMLLTGFFMYLRFPYERLVDSLTAALEREQGVRLEVGTVGPSLLWLGPGIAADGVRLTPPGGTELDFERVAFRPAWSLSWLLARPAIFATLRGPLGEAAGTFTLGRPESWRGELRGLDLAKLPLSLGPGVSLSGKADLDVDLRFAEQGPEGRVRFDASQGTLTHPQLPMPVPFQEVQGELALGGEQTLTIESFEVHSALMSGTITGTVGRAPDPAAAPLHLEADLTAAPAIRGALNAQGVSIGRDGKVSLRILGTAAHPLVQAKSAPAAVRPRIAPRPRPRARR